MGKRSFFSRGRNPAASENAWFGMAGAGGWGSHTYVQTGKCKCNTQILRPLWTLKLIPTQTSTPKKFYWNVHVSQHIVGLTARSPDTGLGVWLGSRSTKPTGHITPWSETHSPFLLQTGTKKLVYERSVPVYGQSCRLLCDFPRKAQERYLSILFIYSTGSLLPPSWKTKKAGGHSLSSSLIQPLWPGLRKTPERAFSPWGYRTMSI